MINITVEDLNIVKTELNKSFEEINIEYQYYENNDPNVNPSIYYGVNENIGVAAVDPETGKFVGFILNDKRCKWGEEEGLPAHESERNLGMWSQINEMSLFVEMMRVKTQ